VKQSELKEAQTDEQETKPVYERAYVCPRCGYDNPPRAGFCFVCAEPLLTEIKKIPGYELEWTNEIDDYLRKQFQKVSLGDLKRDLDRRFGLSIPEMVLLRRAEALSLVSRELRVLTDEQKPEYLKSNIVWMQGAETVRVKGNVSIPENDRVPFNIIVDGSLITQSDVVFQGGLHVKGNTVLGDRNSVMKSLICEEMVVLGRNTLVENLVDSDGPVFVRHGVIVGTGDNGGIASGDTVYVELGFSGKTKIYASSGVKVVKNIHDILPDSLKQAIGKMRARVTPIPPVVSVKPIPVRVMAGTSTEKALVTSTPGLEVQKSKTVASEEAEPSPLELQPIAVVHDYKSIGNSGVSSTNVEAPMRDFGKVKETTTEPSRLKVLEPSEAKVYKLVASGTDVTEIALRLLIDPFELQESLNSLVKKGYLDNNFKPKRRKAKEKPLIPIPKTVQESPPEEETKDEGAVSTEKPSTDEPSTEAETNVEEPSGGTQETLNTERSFAVKLKETKSDIENFGTSFSSHGKRSKKEDNNNADSSDGDSSGYEDAIRELTEL